MRKKKYIHFVGIKGVGMTPLAIMAKEAGFCVTGSDIDEEFISDEALKTAGINTLVGFSPSHITNPDLVITTGAHGGFDNIETKKAKEIGIKILTHGQAVGVFMEGKIFNKNFQGISVAGTHGKTTTTAMIATILHENHMDPSFVIGAGSVSPLGAPGHFGKGKYFIAEADEYATEPKHDKTPKFLWQNPKISVFTNIEFDHPDVYSSMEDISNAFLRFTGNLPENGTLIACGDDREIQKMLKKYKKKAITYGFSPGNNYVITKVNISEDHMFFWVNAYERSLGEFMLRVTGEHNALNALAAFIVAIEIGLPVEKIKPALLKFKGSKRRMELIGELKTGAKVYDDYAHHPTEIKKSLSTLRRQYPKKKIICFFQPHTFSRTKRLFDDFLRAFEDADGVVLSDIYASVREPFDKTVSSEMLCEAIKKYKNDVIYLEKLSDMVEYINQKKFRSDTILLSMGAGDIYKIKNGLKFT